MKTYFPEFVIVFSLLPVSSFAENWRPIDPSELSQKTPKIDQGADAEAIFWDIRIEDRLQGQDLSFSMAHYIRIKIFSDRGKEQYSTIEIPRFGKQNISEVAGRTIKPDGTIIELKKDAIFDRELVKTKGAKLRGKTFVLPNVEAGDIIEYRYRETHENESSSHLRLYFQRDLPMWRVTYHIKPLEVPWLPYAMRSISFQCNHPPFEKEQGGFFATSMSNMPAFKAEPDMPPEDQLRAWVLIYYEEDKKIQPDKYWKETGKNDFARLKPLTKADDSVKKTAAELISGADKPEAKLAALDQFCRTKIRNIDSSLSHLTAEERKALKENKSPGDTLKQKAGHGIEIDFLFVALASAAGFDARMARVPDRGDTFFNPKVATTYFMENFSVAVKQDDKWVFFDPSSPLIEPGMLRWQEEGGGALVSDPKEGFFAFTQTSTPSRSKKQRRASFQLQADGTLQGTVTYTYSGHVGRSQKFLYEGKTPSDREQDWKESLQNRMSTAELSDFEMTNVADDVKPLVVTHKVTVPGYGTRTGKRILLQPAFFERNIAPRFSESKRKWDLYFDYGWSEDDEVTFDLPDGWELDQPVAPISSKLSDVGNYSVEVRKTSDGRKLIYRRKFEWGLDMRLLFPVAGYTQLKNIFDFVQQQDAYTISLKPVAQ